MAMLETIRVQLPSEIAAQIAESLRRFKIEDIPVIGRTMLLEGGQKATPIRIIETGPVRLTQLCAQAGLWREHCVPRNRSAYERVRPTIDVVHEDVLIGTIDHDYIFSYSNAPDLRTCVGWAVATDQGRWHLFEYDLDRTIQAITRSLQKLGDPSVASRGEVMKVYCEGEFGEAIRVHLRQGNGSHFIGGCTEEAKNAIWRVATRTLFGQEHAGFIFNDD